MPVYHVKCYETVNFTVSIEAESEEEARELAHEDINSHEVIAESTTDWDIEEVILESEEWYNNKQCDSQITVTWFPQQHENYTIIRVIKQTT